ncbi:hypothetical protein D3C71_2053420 [compost metagenome]
MAAEVFERAQAAVAAGEEHAVVMADPVALGQQQRPRVGALPQQHRGAGGLADPVDPAAAQIAGHLLHVLGHQDAALADAYLGHARDHVIQ